MPVGRPSEYLPKYAEQAAKLCRLGATDVELAGFFNVSISTIGYWAVHFEPFSTALKVGKGEPDDRVERSLYKKAMGYSFESEKIFTTKEGEVIRVATIEHVPPSDTALIFWLKNRRRDEWRDRQEVTGKDGGPIETNNTFSFEDLSPADRNIVRALLASRVGQPDPGGEGT